MRLLFIAVAFCIAALLAIAAVFTAAIPFAGAFTVFAAVCFCANTRPACTTTVHASLGIPGSK